MSTTIALQLATPGPIPVPIAASRPRSRRPSMTGKENLPRPKPTSSSPSVGNIRPRRERPCDACRRRKSRCVIHEGAVLCVLCEFHKQDCTFVQSPQPRKRKLAGDVKKDDASKRRSVEGELSPPLKSIRTPPVPKVTSTPPQGPVTPRPRQRQSQRVCTALSETLGLKSDQHSRYIGLSTPFDPLLIGLTKFDSRNESSFNLGTLRKVNDHECFIMLPDETPQSAGADLDMLNSIEQIVAPHGPSLVDLYFRVVHPSYPILQKQLFLERFRGGDRSFSPALLAGIYLLALNWWSHDGRLSSLSKPPTAGLEAIASRALAAAMERPKLSAVQAGLLLSQRPEADSWSLTTQLVAVGQELGLHLDCSGWSIPAWERGLRKRLAWALYMQDKWSSLIHGRPSHIFGANWAVKSISEDDFVEDDGGSDSGGGNVKQDESEADKLEREKGEALFSQMITLTGIMSEVMDTFYTQTAIQEFTDSGENSTRLILDRAKPVQIKLKEWFAKLPGPTRMDHPDDGNLSSTGYLHLAYFATEITLHRRIVQSLDAATADPYLMYICRSAAKTRLISAMDFVNRLKPAHLQSFWFFPSKTNFTLIGTFGTLLYATAPSKEEADFYKTRLREYRWTLSVSSDRARFLDFAVHMLDASRAMLANLAEKPVLAQNAQVSSAGVPAPIQSSSSLPPTRPPPPTFTSSSRSADADAKPDDDMTTTTTGPSRTLSRYTSTTSSFSGFRDELPDAYALAENLGMGGSSIPGLRRDSSRSSPRGGGAEKP